MLLVIIGLLQLRIQRFMHWLTTPSHPRHSCKHSYQTGGDYRHSPKKPEWLKAEIIRLKALMPQAGCRSIADICNRRFAASRNCGRVAAQQRGTHRRTPCGCVTVGKTFVHQILQRHDYEIQILRRNLNHAKPKAVPRNLIWGIDLTGKTDTHKNLHALFGIFDPRACPELSRRRSRALLYLQALHNKTSRAFRRGLKLLDIRHQHTDPGCSWQNGRIERLFGTLKQKLDQRIYFPLPLGEGLRVREQLNRDLQTFRYWYNHIRPHQNLNGKTPAEAWSGGGPYTKPPKQEQWFEAWDGLLMGYELRH